MKHHLSERVLNFFPVAFVFYEIANYLANDAYLPAMPQIASEFHISHHAVQLTLTMFFLGNASMQLLLGPIADRYGRRKLLLMGGVLFLMTTLICAWTHHFSILLIARFFQGSAVTSLVIAGYATIHDMYSQTRAIKTLAWMSSITILAPALGPLLGSLLLLIGDWRFIFKFLAMWAFCGWVVLYQWMPETCERPIAIEPKKLLHQYGRIICHLNFMKPVILLSLMFAAMIAWIAAGPFLVMDFFHYSARSFGLIQSGVFGSYMLGTHVVGWWIEKTTLDRILKMSASLTVLAGILGFILNVMMQKNLLTVVFPMMMFTFGAGIGSPVLNRLAIEGSSEPMGMKVALFAAFMGISGFLGSVVVSSFYTGTAFGFSLILFAFSVALWLCYFRQHHESREV